VCPGRGLEWGTAGRTRGVETEQAVRRADDPACASETGRIVSIITASRNRLAGRVSTNLERPDGLGVTDLHHVLEGDVVGERLEHGLLVHRERVVHVDCSHCMSHDARGECEM
jgi:hypothetical protein